MIVLGSVAIIVLGLLFMQYNYYHFIERQVNVDLSPHEKQLKEIEKKLKETNERLDGIMLRVGFKL